MIEQQTSNNEKRTVKARASELFANYSKKTFRTDMIPDRYLVNRADVQSICEEHIKRQRINTSIRMLISLIAGALLSTFLSIGESVFFSSLFWIFFAIMAILIVTKLILNFREMGKKDILSKINQHALENADYTGIFLITRIIPAEKTGLPPTIQLMTEDHPSSRSRFVAYMKHLEEYLENGVLDLDKIKNNLLLRLVFARISLKWSI